MTDKALLKPIQPASIQQNANGLRQQNSTSGAQEISSEAVVSDVKPDLSGEVAAAEAQRIAASLSSNASKGLDAIKPLDKAAIDKLLSDD